jgi:hypothetical protein
MSRTRRAYLLIATAVGEAATGLLLLVSPAFPLWLLVGVEHPSPETAVVARVAGAALLAIGVGCWLGRGDQPGPAQRGLIAGVLVYSTTVAVVLAYAGLSAGLVGIALWPAVGLHALLSVWCVICLSAG